MLCKTLKIYLLLIGMVLSRELSNEEDMIPQQYLSTNTTIIEENDLRILSWNIKMFPIPYGFLYNTVNRAENIIEALKSSETYDVILFQEAFSLKIRKMIFDELQLIYPYQVNPKDKTLFFKLNSGLWAISRIPITLIDDIVFTQVRSSDRLASKGAKLYSASKNQQEFHIINTHMQADYKTQYSDVRISQYTQIQDKLILPNENPEVPLILCGDLNISQPSRLLPLLKKLKLKNGFLSGNLQFSTMGKYKELLDYILVKTDFFQFQSIERKIQDLACDLSINPTQLSDHYPIEGIFRW